MPGSSGSDVSSQSLNILAIVTLDRDSVSGGTPVFVAKDKQEQDEIAADLARILRADVAELANGIFVLKPVLR